MFYKSVLTSKHIFSKLWEKKNEKYWTHIFLRVFVTKWTSQILVFLAFKRRRHSTTISDKILKLLLSTFYHDWQK